MARDDLFAKFERLDRKLVAAGFPPTSPWWLATLRRFLEGRAWQLVVRAGRRGGKSSTLCRLAVLLAMESWPIPPGDIGFVMFISARLEDAHARLTTIEAILRALRVPFRRRDTTIELEGRPIAFRVIPATIAAASGPTTIAVIADEVAKWRDHDTGANPAEEVLAAIRPTLATMAKHGARMVLSSSPFGKLDAHAKAFDQGDTDAQIVAFAESWVANPSLSIEDTHKLEPDPKKWAREYAAIPQAAASSAFELDDINRCFRPAPPLLKSTPVLIVDPSTGGGDSFTWLVARWALRAKDGVQIWWRYYDRDTGRTFWRQGPSDGTRSERLQERYFSLDDPTLNGRYKWQRCALERHEVDPDGATLLVEEVGGVDGRFALEKSSRVFDAAADCAKKYGARWAFGDQRDALAAYAEFNRRGLKYEPIAWTVDSKRIAVETVRRWMAGGRLILPDHEALRRQLTQYETRITASGYETFGGRGRGAHDDYAALIVTLALAETNGRLPRSPMHAGQPRGVVRDWPGL